SAPVLLNRAVFVTRIVELPTNGALGSRMKFKNGVASGGQGGMKNGIGVIGFVSEAGPVLLGRSLPPAVVFWPREELCASEAPVVSTRIRPVELNSAEPPR